jgi:chaperonin GroES
MRLVPTSDRLLIMPAKRQETTSSGIIIPETAKDKPVQGKVVAIGEGKVNNDGTLIPMRIQMDDEVLYNKHAGTEVSMDGDVYLLMKESDVLAILYKD